LQIGKFTLIGLFLTFDWFDHNNGVSRAYNMRPFLLTEFLWVVFNDRCLTLDKRRESYESCKWVDFYL